MKMHQDSLEELQEKHDEEHEPLYEEVGNFHSIQQTDSDCVFSTERLQLPPPLDRTKKPVLNQEPIKPIKPQSPEKPEQERDTYSKTQSLDRNLCVDNLKMVPSDLVRSPMPDRGTGASILKTASLERQVEPNRTQTGSARSQVVKSALDLSTLPLFFEPTAPSDPTKIPAWKKVSPVSSNMQDKLLQELNTMLNKKNDPGSGPGQQVT